MILLLSLETIYLISIVIAILYAQFPHQCSGIWRGCDSMKAFFYPWKICMPKWTAIAFSTRKLFPQPTFKVKHWLFFSGFCSWKCFWNHLWGGRLHISWTLSDYRWLENYIHVIRIAIMAVLGCTEYSFLEYLIWKPKLALFFWKTIVPQANWAYISQIQSHNYISF